MRDLFLVVFAALLVSLVAGLFGEGYRVFVSNSRSDIKESFEEIAREVNEKSPFYIDYPSTILNSASVGPGLRLTWDYTMALLEPGSVLLDANKDDVTVFEILKRRQLIREGCEDEDMLGVMEDGAEFRYIYRLNNRSVELGAVVMDFTLNIGHCR